MTTPFTLEAPATSNFNMTSDTEFGTLRLLALGWETKDRRLVPSFSKVLSTIAEVGLACGLAQPSHNPKNGFQFRMVEREELSDELIKQNSEKEGDEWLGRYVYGKASPHQSSDPFDWCGGQHEFREWIDGPYPRLYFIWDAAAERRNS
jgi:hypothetical protein